MTTDRIQRRVEQLLDQADEAVTKLDWAVVRDRAQAVLTIDPENADAKSYMEIAERGLGAAGSHPDVKRADSPSEVALSQPPTSHPTSFANGRYQVRKFLGEGGKKKVYLAHDTVLDRDVAFALIKTEKLDETARTRIKREAQAMGKLGDHPNIVSIYDMGEEHGRWRNTGISVNCQSAQSHHKRGGQLIWQQNRRWLLSKRRKSR